jgi:hypothetical protein
MFDLANPVRGNRLFRKKSGDRFGAVHRYRKIKPLAPVSQAAMGFRQGFQAVFLQERSDVRSIP